ncbi:MAG: uracil-DNA glycosylase [Chitinophagales bacterium]
MQDNDVQQKRPEIDATWFSLLEPEFEKAYFQYIRTFLKAEKHAGKRIYPPGSQIFRAYNMTPFPDVKVIILGQDPYHGSGQAHGLCFSVPDGVKPPPSLMNIFKELNQDLHVDFPASGNLESWARQGVFLLNAILTVEADMAASHSKIGWQYFTDETIKQLSMHRKHLVFMLWGKFAQQKKELIDGKKHLILEAAHPSPFSADKGFFGCRHFSKANAYLISNGISPVNWSGL